MIPDLGISLFHGTNYESHLLIQESGYLGWDYNGSKVMHVTDDFYTAFLFGSIIYEFNLPFQKDLLKIIPNTDTGERELRLEFFIPMHRVKRIWYPDIDYPYDTCMKVNGFKN